MSAVEIMKKRRTIRKFQNREISREDIVDMIECARRAPSGANLQPLKYFVANEPALCSQVFECTAWAGYLKGAGTPKEGERPTTYIAILCDREIRSSGFEADGGAAAMSIILAAEERGIGSCWIGSINRERLSKLLELDEKYEIFALIALGYPAESPVLEEFDGDIKYFKDGQGVLHVPKRPLEEIILNKF